MLFIFHSLALTLGLFSCSLAAPLFNTPVAQLPDSKAKDDRIAAFLAAHHEIRHAYGSPPLHWSESLAAKAQVWANACNFRPSGRSLMSEPYSLFDQQYGPAFFYVCLYNPPGNVIGQAPCVYLSLMARYTHTYLSVI
jgi:hypothetical protein